MPAAATDFSDLFRSHLAEVERCAVLEVQRLGEELEALRAENAELRQQLAGRAGTEAEGPSRRASDTSVRLPVPWNSQTTSFLSVPPGCLRAGVPDHITQKTETNSTIYKSTGLAQAVVTSTAFEYGTLALIGMNAVWLAIDLDFNGKALTESPVMFQVIEHLFVLLFLLDVAVRFLAFKHKRMVFRDRWFLFDSVLVACMLVDSWLLTIIILATGGSTPGGLGSLPVLRILRFLRLARVARMCAAVPELQTMVSALFAGVRTVCTTSLLLLVTTYGFAIALRQLGEKTTWGAEHFGSVPQAIYTLFVESLLPDNIELLGRMGREQWYCALLYSAFLVIVTFLLMNMLLGVLCDVISQVSGNAKSQHIIDSMSQKLEIILRSIDGNYDGCVSKTEFKSIIDNREAVRLLTDVGVDVIALVGEADLIFSMHTHLPFEDFKEEVLSFRRSSQASMGTVVALRRFVHMGLDQVAGRIAKVENLLCQTIGSEQMAPNSFAELAEATTTSKKL